VAACVSTCAGIASLFDRELFLFLFFFAYSLPTDKKKAAQSRAIKDGTAVEKEASGKPKKPAPPSTVCALCKKDFMNVEKDKVQLKGLLLLVLFVFGVDNLTILNSTF
jgi:hypothetical protein